MFLLEIYNIGCTVINRRDTCREIIIVCISLLQKIGCVFDQIKHQTAFYTSLHLSHNGIFSVRACHITHL